MKKLLPILLLLPCCCFSQTSFTLTGHLKGWEGQYIYLSYRGISLQRIWDSALVTKEKFEFRGRIDSSYTYARITTLKTDRIKADANPELSAPLFLANSTMQIELVLHDFHAAKLTGSVPEDQYLQLGKVKAAATKWADPAVNAYHKAIDACKALETDPGLVRIKAKQDSLVRLAAQRDSLSVLNDSAVDEEMALDKDFIKIHPNSYLSAYLAANLRGNSTLHELRQFYAGMSPEIKKSYYGMQVLASITALDKVAPGKMAPDFNSLELGGQKINLTQFRGKYVLLDFWGSWCQPCRELNPRLIALYHQYKDKGIEFISIDCADNLTAWKKAVAEDGIGIWKNIRETEIPSNHEEPLSRKYDIQYYPTQFLIDPNGRIAYRFGEVADSPATLEEKLGEVMGRKGN